MKIRDKILKILYDHDFNHAIDKTTDKIIQVFKDILPKKKGFEDSKSQRTTLRRKGYNQVLKEIKEELWKRK